MFGQWPTQKRFASRWTVQSTTLHSKSIQRIHPNPRLTSCRMALLTASTWSTRIRYRLARVVVVISCRSHDEIGPLAFLAGRQRGRAKTTILHVYCHTTAATVTTTTMSTTTTTHFQRDGSGMARIIHRDIFSWFAVSRFWTCILIPVHP
jgi:hypothetical protein